MAQTILILNGPNLNLLGTREPEIYGTETLADLERRCADAAALFSLHTDFRQSNHEGVLVDWIHEARGRMGGIIINAGAYSHTSIALLDALKAVALPVIEVHLSDLSKREPFRHHSYISLAASEIVTGRGGQGYADAVAAMAALLDGKGAS